MSARLFRWTVAAAGMVLTVSVASSQPCITPGVPCPAMSIVPDCVMLLPGASDFYTNALTAGYQPFTLTVNDGGGAVVGGTAVTLDLFAPTDVTIAAVQDPAYVWACATKTISAPTNAVGMVTFVVRGAGRNSLPFGGIGPGAFDQIDVYADGGVFGPVLLKSITAVTPDENGAGLGGTVTNGVDPGDGAFFRFDLFNYSVTAGRSDLNCDGLVDAPDGAILRDFQFNDLASLAPQLTPYCP